MELTLSQRRQVDSEHVRFGEVSVCNTCQNWMAINWNWIQIKLNSSLSGRNNSRANTSLYFLFSFSASKVTQQNLLGILEQYSTKVSPSTHMGQQSAPHAFILFGSEVYSLLPWSWWCKITCNCYCVLSSSLLQFTLVWYHWHWPHQTSMCSESTGPHCDKVTSFYLQCCPASFPSLVASKI